MSSAKEKWFEAKYFLERMRENASDRDAFKYNLSAFLSAARSIRWILRREHLSSPGFEQWWNSKGEWLGLRKGEEMDDITDPIRAANVFFDEQRNLTIHQQSVRPRAHVAVHATSQVTVRSSAEMTIIRADGARETTRTQESEPPQTPTSGETRTEWRWYFEDLPTAVDVKDVITLSEEHLARLEDFLSECESRFGS